MSGLESKRENEVNKANMHGWGGRFFTGEGGRPSTERGDKDRMMPSPSTCSRSEQAL